MVQNNFKAKVYLKGCCRGNDGKKKRIISILIQDSFVPPCLLSKVLQDKETIFIKAPSLQGKQF